MMSANPQKQAALKLLGARRRTDFNDLYDVAVAEDPDVLSPLRLEPWVGWRKMYHPGNKPAMRNHVFWANHKVWSIDLGWVTIFRYRDFDLRKACWRWVEAKGFEHFNAGFAESEVRTREAREALGAMSALNAGTGRITDLNRHEVAMKSRYELWHRVATKHNARILGGDYGEFYDFLTSLDMGREQVITEIKGAMVAMACSHTALSARRMAASIYMLDIYTNYGKPSMTPQDIYSDYMLYVIGEGLVATTGVQALAWRGGQT